MRNITSRFRSNILLPAIYLFGILTFAFLLILSNAGCVYLIEVFGGGFWAFIAARIIHLWILGIVLLVGRYFYDKIKKSNFPILKPSYPYLENYGANYQLPTFEDFKIDPKEYKSYYKRLQFDTYLIPLVLSVCLLFVFSSKPIVKEHISLFIFIGVPISYILFFWILRLVNRAISSRYKHHKTFKNYEDNFNIYHKVKREIFQKELYEIG